MDVNPIEYTIKNSYDEGILKKRLESVGKYMSDDDKILMDTCKDFETIFVHMMLKEMRKTIPDGGLTEKTTAREIFEDMYDYEMAQAVCKEGDGLGLAKMMYEQFKNNNIVIE
jgi:flagellar protein FlgJ